MSDFWHHADSVAAEIGKLSPEEIVPIGANVPSDPGDISLGYVRRVLGPIESEEVSDAVAKPRSRAGLFKRTQLKESGNE